MTSVIVEEYSEKAIVVRNTLEHHGSILTELGGTFNDRLKGGRGWIFPKHKLTQVRSMIEKLNSGQYGNEYEQKTSKTSPAVDMVSKSDYLSLLSRVELLEALVLKKTPAEVKEDTKERAKDTVKEAVKEVKETKERKTLSKPVKERSPPKDDVPDWVDEFEQEPTEKKRLVPTKLSK